MSGSSLNLSLYAVTDRRWAQSREGLLAQIQEALEGGITCLQVREKDLSRAAFLEEVKAIRDLCAPYGVPVIVNDNVDLALEAQADGVHLGKEDMPIGEARKILGPKAILGASARTIADAQAAEAAGASYLGVGACFPTHTKADAKGISPELLAEIAGSVSIPVVAIGGITLQNVGELDGTGIDGIAVVSAIFGAPQVKEACQALRHFVDTHFVK